MAKGVHRSTRVLGAALVVAALASAPAAAEIGRAHV